MIRINLLKGRSGAHGVIAGGGSSPLLAKWQLWAAVAAVLAAVGILAMTLRAPSDEQMRAGAEPETARPAPEPAEVAAAPKPRPASLDPNPAKSARSKPAPSKKVERPPITRTASPSVSEGEANRLTMVTATPAGDGLDVFFAIRGEPTFRVIRVDGPSRLAVDIDQSRVTIARQNRQSEVDHPLVTRIRIAQNQLEPPRIRAVLEVPSFPSVKSRVDANGITLELR